MLTCSSVSRAYSIYLAVFAMFMGLSLFLSSSGTPSLRREHCYAAVLPVLLFIHAKVQWNGAQYFSFAVASLCARVFCVLLMFFGPLLQHPSFRISKHVVAIPHVPVWWGGVELIWAVLHAVALACAVSTNTCRPGKCRKLPLSLRGVNRILYGGYLFVVSYWWLTDPSRFLGLLSLPATAQTLFVEGKFGSWSVPNFLNTTASSQGIGPFLLAACLICLLGFFNITAGLFGLSACLRAGEQASIAFAITCTMLVLFDALSYKALLLPFVDVACIFGLYVYDLEMQSIRNAHTE